MLFVPWLIARRQLPSIASACAGLAVVLLLPATIYGWNGNIDLHREWWRTVTETTAPNLSIYDNVSVAGMFYRWVGPGDLSARLAYGTGLVLLGVAALVFFLRRGIAFPEGVEGALLLTLMPLLSPQGWDYVFLIATPAIVYLANYLDLLPRPMRVLTVDRRVGDRFRRVRSRGTDGVLHLHAAVVHQPLFLRRHRRAHDPAPAKDRLKRSPDMMRP